MPAKDPATAPPGDGRAADEAAVAVLRAAHPSLVAVYRFGSSVTGTARTDSDIDLAVLGERPLEPVERFDLQERIAAVLRRQVDLVDLRTASTVMASQVITTGVLLFEGKANERERFEDFIYGRYARLNEERRGILERVAAEGTIYGR